MAVSTEPLLDQAKEGETVIESPNILWEKQVAIVNGGQSGRRADEARNTPGGRSVYRTLEAQFKLEVMEETSVKTLMGVFYLSVIFAFFTKIYSERVMEITNVCGTGGDRFFSTWNSTSCRSVYDSGEEIPMDYLPGNFTFTCPPRANGSMTGRCYKWDGELSGLSFLNRMVFIAFIVEEPAPNRTSAELGLWFMGFSHRLGDDKQPLGQGEVVPPSQYYTIRDFLSPDVGTWPREDTKLECKEGFNCDVAIFSEPFFAVNGHRRMQLVLLNAHELEELVGEDAQIGVAWVYHFWVITVLDLTVRYVCMGIALGMVVHMVWILGLRNYISMKPHFRQMGTRQSKPWMMEQRWMLVVLILLLVYLNPNKLPQLLSEADNGRRVDGEGYKWNDRVSLFCDRNLALYYVNLFRVFEVVILACCRWGKVPIFSCRHWRRSWVLWCGALWYLALLLQDWFMLYYEYHSYYHREKGTGQAFAINGSFLSRNTVMALLIFLWVLAMFYFFYSGSSSLLQQHYWDSRSRQLSFRFFFFLFFWHMVYTITQYIYCFYKFHYGRAVLDHLICSDLTSGSTVGDMIANTVFVLLLGVAFSPVVITKDDFPPDVLGSRQAWTTSKWPSQWVQFVNNSGNSIMYFFFWDTERRTFHKAQEQESTETSGPQRGFVHTARRTAETARQTIKAAADLAKEKAQVQMDQAKQAMTERMNTLRDTSARWRGSIIMARRPSETARQRPADATPKDPTSWPGEGEPDFREQQPSSKPPASASRERDEPSVDPFTSSSSLFNRPSTSHMAAAAAGVGQGTKIKPFFCLELAVDLLCLSWEVYGKDPGSDHTSETMQIDCARHGYELLEVIRACVDRGKTYGFVVTTSLHPHGLSYRYVPAYVCAQCNNKGNGPLSGMVYACPDPECEKERNGRYHVCSSCCKDCMKEEQLSEAMLRNTGKAEMSWLEAARRQAEESITAITSQEDEIKLADLQAIIAKDKDRIVVAFRGTDCFENVKTDCQFFRDIVDEMVEDKAWALLDIGSYVYRLKRMFGFGLPRCHRGFLCAFHILYPEVIDRLRPIVQLHPELEICITGHSLGGALATLMAYWVKRFLQRNVVVYTFGSPRVGNRTFQAIYDLAVPETFRVVNQCDIVQTVPLGAWGYLFKHVGKEVCIDKRGNLIIEPTFVEKFIGPTKSARTKTGLFKLRGGSFADHMMLRYVRSMNMICQYFRVKDCEVIMLPKDKPTHIGFRRRWTPDGKCIMCQQNCKEDLFVETICQVTKSIHLPFVPEPEVLGSVSQPTSVGSPGAVRDPWLREAHYDDSDSDSDYDSESARSSIKGRPARPFFGRKQPFSEQPSSALRDVEVRTESCIELAPLPPPPPCPEPNPANYQPLPPPTPLLHHPAGSFARPVASPHHLTPVYQHQFSIISTSSTATSSSSCGSSSSSSYTEYTYLPRPGGRTPL